MLAPWQCNISYLFFSLPGCAGLDYISDAHFLATIWPVQTLPEVNYILIWPDFHTSY